MFLRDHARDILFQHIFNQHIHAILKHGALLKIISDYWNPFEILFCPLSNEPFQIPAVILHPYIRPTVYNYQCIVDAIDRGELEKFGINHINKHCFIRKSDPISELLKVVEANPQHYLFEGDRMVTYYDPDNCYNLVSELKVVFDNETPSANSHLSKKIKAIQFFATKQNFHLEYRKQRLNIKSKMFNITMACFITSLSSDTYKSPFTDFFELDLSHYLLIFLHNFKIIDAACSSLLERESRFDTFLEEIGFLGHKLYSDKQQLIRLLTFSLLMVHQSFFSYNFYREHNQDPIIQTMITFILCPLNAIGLFRFFDMLICNAKSFFPKNKNISSYLLSAVSLFSLMQEMEGKKIPALLKYSWPLTHLPRIFLSSQQSAEDLIKIIKKPKILLEPQYDSKGFVECQSITFANRLFKLALFAISLYAMDFFNAPFLAFMSAIVILNETSIPTVIKSADNRYRLMPPPIQNAAALQEDEAGNELRNKDVLEFKRRQAA